MKAPANSSGSFQLPPADTHFGRLIRIIDMGTTYNDMYQKDQHKICLMYELTECLMDEDENGERKPFIIAEFPTLSMNEKANLRKRIETWRGAAFESDEEAESFEIEKMLGACGLVTIIHGKKQNGDTKATIASIIKLPKGMNSPDPVNPLVLLELEYEKFDPKILETLSDKMQQIIKSSHEYQEIINKDNTNQALSDKPMPNDFDDDIPF